MKRQSHYDTDTLNAYRTAQRAAEYKRHHTSDWSWAHFVTWRRQHALARELKRYAWSADDRLLDIPCGTGMLGKLLHSFPFRIVASDISLEMMALARTEYPKDRLIGFVEADITNPPFPRGSFDCVVVFGFLHRVPPQVKRATLQAIATLSSRVVVVTCSVDSPLQRFKQRILLHVKPGHVPAPCPVSLEELTVECEAQGLRVIRAFMVVPFLSAQAIVVLERVDAS